MKIQKIKIGDKFNKLEIIELLSKEKDNRVKVKVKCECGNIKNILVYNLTNNITKSCGCLHKEILRKRNTKHGLRSHILYKRYLGILTRCNNVKNKDYKNYGGRGIKICDEWLDFKNFYTWAMLNGWKSNLEIERKNNNGNYEPNNCKFTNRIEQCNNKRNNHLITAFGETKTLTQWSRDNKCTVNRKVLSNRINSLKWPNERAIITPSRKKNETSFYTKARNR